MPVDLLGILRIFAIHQNIKLFVISITNNLKSCFFASPNPEKVKAKKGEDSIHFFWP
jgi:hypothetical protein